MGDGEGEAQRHVFAEFILFVSRNQETRLWAQIFIQALPLSSCVTEATHFSLGVSPLLN